MGGENSIKIKNDRFSLARSHLARLNLSFLIFIKFSPPMAGSRCGGTILKFVNSLINSNSQLVRRLALYRYGVGLADRMTVQVRKDPDIH